MSRSQKSTTLYPHPFSKAYWRDAAAEMKDIHMLVFAALMIAVRVAMKPLEIRLGPSMVIPLAYIANALGAMVFGPVVAIPAAIVSDFLGWVIKPIGPYFLPYVLTEVASSVTFALFLYRAKVNSTRLILSRFAICLFVNILLGTPINQWYRVVMLGKTAVWMDFLHILKNVTMFPLESMILIPFMALMIPITNRLHLTYGRDDKEAQKNSLRFNKKQLIMTVALVLVGIMLVPVYLNQYYKSTSLSASYEAAERYTKNCEMNQNVLDKTDDWDDETTVTIIESAYRQFGKGTTTYNVAIYIVDENRVAEKAAEQEDSKTTYDLDTLRGYSKSKAAADDAMQRVAYATIKVSNKNGEVLSFEIDPAPAA